QVASYTDGNIIAAKCSRLGPMRIPCTRAARLRTAANVAGVCSTAPARHVATSNTFALSAIGTSTLHGAARTLAICDAPQIAARRTQTTSAPWHARFRARACHSVPDSWAFTVEHPSHLV